MDTKAIQAIHDRVITRNNRVLVSHSDPTMWNLHIKNVTQEDEGRYMCQINTDPVKSQVSLSCHFFEIVLVRLCIIVTNVSTKLYLLCRVLAQRMN